MKLTQVFSVLVFANAFDSVLSCGGGPQPCSWTTCRLEWRNDWGPNVPSGHCITQRRNGHHITSNHNGKGSCPSPSRCSPQTQSRTLCKFGFFTLGLLHSVRKSLIWKLLMFFENLSIGRNWHLLFENRTTGLNLLQWRTQYLDEFQFIDLLKIWKNFLGRTGTRTFFENVIIQVKLTLNCTMHGNLVIACLIT